MVQVIVFFVAFGILVATGAGAIGAFLGALALSFIIPLIILPILAAICMAIFGKNSQ